MENNYF